MVSAFDDLRTLADWCDEYATTPAREDSGETIAVATSDVSDPTADAAFDGLEIQGDRFVTVGGTAQVRSAVAYARLVLSSPNPDARQATRAADRLTDALHGLRGGAEEVDAYHALTTELTNGVAPSEAAEAAALQVRKYENGERATQPVLTVVDPKTKRDLWTENISLQKYRSA